MEFFTCKNKGSIRHMRSAINNHLLIFVPYHLQNVNFLCQ